MDMVNPAFIHSFRIFLLCLSKSTTLRGTPDYSIDTVSELTRQSATGTVSEGLAQGPYMTAIVGFEPAAFRMQGTEPTTEPPRFIISVYAPSTSKNTPISTCKFAIYTVYDTVIECLVFRCNGGFPEAAWTYYQSTGLVTGGQYNSHQVF